MELNASNLGNLIVSGFEAFSELMYCLICN